MKRIKTSSNITADKKFKVAVIGARGYVGSELLPLLNNNNSVEVVAVSSRELTGDKVSQHIPEFNNSALSYSEISPEIIKNNSFFQTIDIYFLALPNQVASTFITAIEKISVAENIPIIIDISADHRFSDDWVYGLPELNKEALSDARKIANPGCYATACMLGLAPVKDLLTGRPQAFGVSGYSGAGKTPNDKNNQMRLKDNFIPYALTNHMHEREVSHQLGVLVNFTPHVMPHFRGISVTLSFCLAEKLKENQLYMLYHEYYRSNKLVQIRKVIPQISEVSNCAGVLVGGICIDERSPESTDVRLVVALDNLLKGAASQAMQNMNVALGIDELTGLDEKGWSK